MNYYMPPETAAAAAVAVYSAAPFTLHVYRRLAKTRLRLKSENKKRQSLTRHGAFAWEQHGEEEARK